jgi:hypothetical protein
MLSLFAELSPSTDPLPCARCTSSAWGSSGHGRRHAAFQPERRRAPPPSPRPPGSRMVPTARRSRRRRRRIRCTLHRGVGDGGGRGDLVDHHRLDHVGQLERRIDPLQTGHHLVTGRAFLEEGLRGGEDVGVMGHLEVGELRSARSALPLIAPRIPCPAAWRSRQGASRLLPLASIAREGGEQPPIASPGDPNASARLSGDDARRWSSDSSRSSWRVSAAFCAS